MNHHVLAIQTPIFALGTFIGGPAFGTFLHYLFSTPSSLYSASRHRMQQIFDITNLLRLQLRFIRTNVIPDINYISIIHLLSIFSKILTNTDNTGNLFPIQVPKDQIRHYRRRRFQFPLGLYIFRHRRHIGLDFNIMLCKFILWMHLFRTWHYLRFRITEILDLLADIPTSKIFI